MAKILVTGAAGFMGSHLAERLIQQGHTVYGVDNLMGGEKENVPDGVDFVGVDCCDINNFYWQPKLDLVYHLAAAPHEGLSVFSPNIVTRNTYLSTVAVTTAAIRSGARRVVFTSSMARYGKGTGYGFPFDEMDHPAAPVDPYGIAKVAAEDTLRCLCNAHGVEHVIVVPHNVIGPRQRYYDPFRNVAAIFMNMMLLGKQPYIYGDGEHKRCFSFIDDVVDPMIEAGFKEGLSGEVINIGPDEEFITINDLARRIAGIIGFDLKPVYLDKRPLEVKLAYCCSDKARRLLGYRTTMRLDGGLRRMINWIKECGPRPFEYHLPVELTDSPAVPRTWKERLM